MIKSLKALALVCVLFVASSVALAGDTMGPPAPEQQSSTTTSVAGDTMGPPAPEQQSSTTTSMATSVVTTLILWVVG